MIYQVIVRGKKLESRDLRKLMARAVAEKRSMDLKLRLFSGIRRPDLSGRACARADGFPRQEVSCPL